MIFSIKGMVPLFKMVDRLKGVEQDLKRHPEGDVLTHTLQVLDFAFRETIDVDLILAAMLHDVGKYENSHEHVSLAVDWLKPYCSVKTIWLIYQHRRIADYLEGRMLGLGRCKDLVSHPWLMELIQLRRWDAAGRMPREMCNAIGWVPKYDKMEIVDKLNKAAEKHFTNV